MNNRRDALKLMTLGTLDLTAATHLNAAEQTAAVKKAFATDVPIKPLNAAKLAPDLYEFWKAWLKSLESPETGARPAQMPGFGALNWCHTRVIALL